MEIKFINRATGEVNFERPPAEGLLRFLYDNPFGKKTLLPLAKRKLVSTMYGNKMNKPTSVKKIDKFVSQLGINMEESVKNVSEFTSFNDFFYRKLKPEARPIGNGFVSPGDGRLLAFNSVADVKSFFIKGREFTLAEFLNDKILAERHKNDSLFILRLAPNDYHRYHFPYAGIPKTPKKINGNYFSVSPYALASNFTRVFCENKREFTILNTIDKGEVILVPVGATMVGSIMQSYDADKTIEKGDEMGYFAFGGSTVAVLINSEKITIDADLLENTANKLETFVKMGESIGQ